MLTSKSLKTFLYGISCRKTSITDSVENLTTSPEVVRSSLKKKSHVVYSSESEDSGEESHGV